MGAPLDSMTSYNTGRVSVFALMYIKIWYQFDDWYMPSATNFKIYLLLVSGKT